MARTGTQRSKAQKQHDDGTRYYKEHMEQESIIAEMGDAMRAAYLPYVADCGRMTLRMQIIWFTYVQFAIKTRGQNGKKA